MSRAKVATIFLELRSWEGRCYISCRDMMSLGRSPQIVTMSKDSLWMCMVPPLAELVSGNLTIRTMVLLACIVLGPLQQSHQNLGITRILLTGPPTIIISLKFVDTATDTQVKWYEVLYVHMFWVCPALCNNLSPELTLILCRTSASIQPLG